MKLKTRILLMSILPLLLVVCSTVWFSRLKIDEVLTKSIETGLKSTAISLRDTISVGLEGSYFINDQGEMWKGDSLNVSASTDIADRLRKEAGVDATIFFGDTRYMTSVIDEKGDRVLGTKASEKVIEKVLKQKEAFFDTNVDVVGQKYFAYYLPLYDVTDEPVGMVFVGMPQADAQNQINGIINAIITIGVGVMLFFIVLEYFMIHQMVRAIKKDSRTLEEIADGNLAADMDARLLKRRDEIGEICRSTHNLRSKMVAIIGTIKEQSQTLHVSSRQLESKASDTTQTVDEVERAVEEIAEGAAGQAQETQKATENIILMGNMIAENTKEMAELSENAGLMKQSEEQASAALEELDHINLKARDSIDIIYDQTNVTNESALKIREAISLITSIAKETNLLSLNASIEAARAGEQGRGFAVVASQIQKLAEQSNRSARQIEEIITALIQDSTKAVETMEQVKTIMTRQDENITRISEIFTHVKNGINGSIVGIDHIAERTAKLDEARVRVVDVVQNLTAIAQENAAGTEETSASVTEVANVIAMISQEASELKKVADELEQDVKIFRL